MSWCIVAGALHACAPSRDATSTRAPASSPKPTVEASATARESSKPVATADAGAEWRREELANAMRVASSFQSKSHVRVKSRMQREVAATALDVGMESLAVSYANEIADWRRGEVLALAAQAMARCGDRRGAESCLALAAQELVNAQDWMRERLTSQIAVAYALLGETEKARSLGAQVAPELTGSVEATLSGQASIGELDRQSDAFDAAIATQSMDVVRSGIDGHFAVWSRVRGDAARSARAEKAIRGAAAGLPEELQIGVRLRLADALVSAGRVDDARTEVGEALRILQSRERLPDVEGPLARDVAEAQVRHGDPAGARRLLLDRVGRFERAPADMVDIERADYLRPLAEALHALGDDTEARRVWLLALDAGAVNVNARPRAEDLCLTRLSMIRAGVEPTSEMRSRMAAIESGLKAPW
jgi:tetratricopeptide (TPR) repeat protein